MVGLSPFTARLSDAGDGKSSSGILVACILGVDHEKSGKEKGKWTTRGIVIVSCVSLCVIAILLTIAHQIIQTALFNYLTNQPEIKVTIGSHHGNLS